MKKGNLTQEQESKTEVAPQGQRELAAIQGMNNKALDFISERCPNIPAFFSNAKKLSHFCRTAYVEILKEPKILNCTPQSFEIALEQAASLRLEIGGGLQQCWLIPFWSKKENAYICQLIKGYRAWILLVLRNSGGLVSYMNAEVVREKDDFKYQKGTDAFIHHIPSEEDSPLWKVYSIATMRDGAKFPRIFSKKQVMAAKAVSIGASSPSSPWNGPFEQEQWQKTAILNHAKFLPISSPELSIAFSTEYEGYDFALPATEDEDIAALPHSAGGVEGAKQAVMGTARTVASKTPATPETPKGKKTWPEGPDGELGFLPRCVECRGELVENNDGKGICTYEKCSIRNKPQSL